MDPTLEMDLRLESAVLGRTLMREILFSCGCINALEPDGDERYPAEHQQAIGEAAVTFFTRYPELLTQEFVMIIAEPIIDVDNTFIGVDKEVGESPSFLALNEACNTFWEEGL